MQRYCVVLSLSFLIAVSFCAVPGYANVIAGSITVTEAGTFTITYYLNEPATSVAVDIVNGSGTAVKTGLVGGTSKGMNTVVWDGTIDGGGQAPEGSYRAKITATASVGHSSWEEIASGTYPGGAFATAPQKPMLDVVRNPEDEYYGNVYVIRCRATNADNGIMLFRADASYVTFTNMGQGTWLDTQCDTYDTLDASRFTASNYSSPFRIIYGDDGLLYLTDWVDGNENLWSISPSLEDSTIQRVIYPPDRTASTDVPLNWSGNLTSVDVLGTGASRKLFTLDEDYDDGSGNGNYMILRYDIGQNVSVNSPGVPATASAVIDYTGHWIAADSLGWDILVDRKGADAGSIYVLMENYGGGAKCYKIDSTATTCYWDTATVNPTSLLEASAIPYGFALSPDESSLYIHGSMVDNAPDASKSVYHVRVFKVNTQTGAATEIFYYQPDVDVGLGARGDIACDDAGNIYFFNGADPYLHIWSPPDGPNSHTSYSRFFAIIRASAQPRIWSLYW
jgi:hypothetical protein